MEAFDHIDDTLGNRLGEGVNKSPLGPYLLFMNKSAQKVIFHI